MTRAVDRTLVGKEEAGAAEGGGAAEGQTLTELAYARLRQQLITCEIRPGTTFTESEMAQLLQLSKTPIREAFLRLRLEGLVHVQSRTGYSAAPATLKDVRDVCALRALLEGEAAYRAAEHPELAERQLPQLDKAMTLLAEQNPDGAAPLIEADRSFHEKLAWISGNERLMEALKNVLVHFSRLSYLSIAVDRNVAFMRHSHGELIGAISAGKGERARELAASEVRHAEQMMIQAFISSHSVATTNVSVAPPMHRFYLDIPKESNPNREAGGRSE